MWKREIISCIRKHQAYSKGPNPVKRNVTIYAFILSSLLLND